jgi:hypothetical protein
MYCVTPPDLICDVPLTRNFNVAAADGNTALNSLRNYKVVCICITARHIPFSQPRQGSVCYQCPVMLQSAGQPSNPDTVITDFKKYYWKNFHHQSLPVVQLQAFSDR